MSDTTETLRVLVVDDSQLCQRLVERALRTEAYEPIFANSGTHALELYAQHSPSLVVTDLMMPDFSGIELCRRIRSDLQRAYTYIILLSSVAEKASVVEGLAAGADDYLTKPFDPAELLARIGVGRRTIDLHREIDAKNRLLEEMAHTDSLTGLPNRRAIEDWATRQLRGAVRHGFPFWLVLTDLDNFKSINDTFGHDAGDLVLQKFGECLKRNTRASDICGRLGGDEFFVVITHVEEKDIHATVETFRVDFARQEFDFDGKRVKLTASFGIAGLVDKNSLELVPLMRRADKALYAAKSAGRNSVKLDALQTA